MTDIDLSCYEPRHLAEAYDAHRLRQVDLARASFDSRELVAALGHPEPDAGALDLTNAQHRAVASRDAWDLVRLLVWGVLQSWDKSVGYSTELVGVTTLTGDTSTLFTAHGLPKEPATLAAHNLSVRDEDGQVHRNLKSAHWHLHRYVDALTRLGRMIGFQADRKTNATTPMGAIEQAMEQELVRLANATVKLVEERSYEGGLEYRGKRPVVHRGYLRRQSSTHSVRFRAQVEADARSRGQVALSWEEWSARAAELHDLYAW